MIKLFNYSSVQYIINHKKRKSPIVFFLLIHYCIGQKEYIKLSKMPAKSSLPTVNESNCGSFELTSSLVK